jgi:serine protease AprX
MEMGRTAHLDQGIRRLVVAFGATLLLLPAFSTQGSESAPAVAGRLVSVIVESWNGSESAAASVEAVGGRVTKSLPIVDGVTAKIPAGRLDDLARYDHIRHVTPNDDVSFQQATSTEFDLQPARVQKEMGSDRLWDQGITGRGVTVAVLDTGVHMAHPDLAGRVLHCEDMSHEAGTAADCADTFGHGTFMAGLVAGNGASSGGRYKGAAPESKIVAVKAAGYDGSTDVSTILAGIQWVVSHKAQYGIRVLNLSLGTDSAQSHLLSPLNYAVQKAWKSGIVVVVSAGNSGPNSRTILKPADDPYVITVGSSNDEGTLATADDKVPVFSSKGPTRSNGLAKPDVVAPGVHTVSLRSPGSAIDNLYGTTATVEGSYFRGTGTSMSAASVTGVVAQMLQKSPGLVPDQVKARLMNTAKRIATTDSTAAGKGTVDAYAAATSTSTAKANQYLLMGLSTGLGSLDAARGTLDIDVLTRIGQIPLDGEYVLQLSDSLVGTVTGLVPWTGLTYATTGWDPLTWNLTSWLKNDWAASSWKASSWKATEFVASSWKGTTWDNADWVASSWKASSWKDFDWNASSWKASSWKSVWYAAAWY